MVKQISDNEIYLFIKYIKGILWRVVKRLSYKQDTQCLKVKAIDEAENYNRRSIFFPDLQLEVLETPAKGELQLNLNL